LLDYLELLDRAAQGERIEEKEYNMKIFQKTSELVKELDAKYDPEVIVPDDDYLADELFQAGLQLALDVGSYCLDTKRVVKFTEEEIKDRLKEIPERILLGEGKDAREMFVRKPEDKSIPFCHAGVHSPFTEELQPIIAKSLALLPIDGYGTPNILDFEGRRVAEAPMLVWVTRKIVEWAREGLRRAGRPGLHIMSYPLLTRSDVIIGCLGPNHIRKCDSVSPTHIPELYKFDYDILTSSMIAHDYGCFVRETTSGLAGGFAGGWDGSILESIAGQILGEMITRFDYNLLLHSPLSDVNLAGSPEALWAQSLVMQAVSRNSNIKQEAVISAAAEPGIEQSYLERTAKTLSKVCSGPAAIYPVTRNNKPIRSNLGNPLEIKFSIDLTRAAVKLKRKEMNYFVREILKLIPKESLINPPRGKTFDEVYNLTNLKPKEEQLELYRRMKGMIRNLGIFLE
jgi:methylamine--corrinoid protein Co-methyltransferase